MTKRRLLALLAVGAVGITLAFYGVALTHPGIVHPACAKIAAMCTD